MSTLTPALLAGLLDDAAVFPPGNAPLGRAVADHAAHLRSPYAGAVGPLLVRPDDLARTGETDVAVVTGLDEVHTAVAAAGPRLRWLEVALPASATPGEVRSLASLGTDVFVEVPRDDRAEAVLAELGVAGLWAKFRTGGVRADLHPSEAELAVGITTAVAFGVPFKATAGLHHAVRRTDPETGFEEHGFLNLLVATGRAVDGATTADVEAALAARDEAAVAAAALALDPAVREAFHSFGTCSISDPLTELARLDLLPDAWREGAA
ncbi:hypothetical protein [Nocardioides jiangxiensis]|uniref:Transaldolase n=1 Tax=Nocardioides jiangxiensis TaxID=3064524 RepID=A0ABT9B2Z9_9ACTN|nr:hypothetical protein [Nocardioides sp. WY-20]MDO7868603.1 hypothetical protein [Nocardioides sp. WY-20]